MYRLHWEYMAGSIVAQAMLEHIGADYALDHVDMENGAHRAPAYRRLNPTGRVPALTLPEGLTIGETGAIVTLLSERHPEARLTPLPGEADRPQFLYWLNVMTTGGYITMARLNHPERYASSDDAVAQVGVQAAADVDAFFDVMERGIAGGTFFLDRGFSALDLYLAMLTEWPEDRAALFASRPRLAALCEAVGQMPAYGSAMATHALPQSAAAAHG